MPPLAWLALAVAGLVGAWLVGWPAWRSYRQREQRDLNSERYLAWRGRAVRGQRAPMREGMTREERRRLVIAAGLGAVGLVALVAFFTVA